MVKGFVIQECTTHSVVGLQVALIILIIQNSIYSFHQVILYFMESNPLGHLLLKRCRDADYECHLVHNEEQVQEQLEDTRHQAVIIVDALHKSRSPVAAAANKTSSLGEKKANERSIDSLSRSE